MESITLKIKKLNPAAIMPKLATPGSAGMDLTATSLEVDLVPDPEGYYAPNLKKYIFGTGLAFEIPQGYVGLIFPRSSIHKTSMTLTNCVGVVDSDYRGEVRFVFHKRASLEPDYQVGDRVGQLILMKLPVVAIEEVYTLSDTDRGVGGFGSTGK